MAQSAHRRSKNQYPFTMAEAPQEVYTPKPALQVGSKTALTGAGVGLVYSALQNALSTHNHGAMGVLTRTGGTIGFFGMSMLRWP